MEVSLLASDAAKIIVCGNRGFWGLESLLEPRNCRVEVFGADKSRAQCKLSRRIIWPELHVLLEIGDGICGIMVEDGDGAHCILVWRILGGQFDRSVEGSASF